MIVEVFGIGPEVGRVDLGAGQLGQGAGDGDDGVPDLVVLGGIATWQAGAGAPSGDGGLADIDELTEFPVRDTQGVHPSGQIKRPV